MVANICKLLKRQINSCTYNSHSWHCHVCIYVHAETFAVLSVSWVTPVAQMSRSNYTLSFAYSVVSNPSAPGSSLWHAKCQCWMFTVHRPSLLQRCLVCSWCVALGLVLLWGQCHFAVALRDKIFSVFACFFSLFQSNIRDVQPAKWWFKAWSWGWMLCVCVLGCTVYKGVCVWDDRPARQGRGLWKNQKMTLTLTEVCSVKQIIHRTGAEFWFWCT